MTCLYTMRAFTFRSIVAFYMRGGTSSAVSSRSVTPGTTNVVGSLRSMPGSPTIQPANRTVASRLSSWRCNPRDRCMTLYFAVLGQFARECSTR